MTLGEKVRFNPLGITAWLGAVGGCWLSLSLSALPAQAQQPGTLDYGSFCTAIDSKALETHPIHDTILYQHQTMVYEAAGVLAGDSPEVAYEKARRLLDANAPSLTCNLVNFNPRNGNVYKLAVARQADEFINDALNDWHVDLNQIDATDGKTVLDYISDRRATAGPTFARTLDRYYTRFRAAGARHARELG